MALDKKLKKKLFDYDVDTEITQNQVYVALYTVTTTDDSMYSYKEGRSSHASASPRTGSTYLRNNTYQ